MRGQDICNMKAEGRLPCRRKGTNKSGKEELEKAMGNEMKKNQA